MDLHAGQIQGFFDIPVDHLYTNPIFIEYFKKFFRGRKDIVVVSPDAGGVERARALAKRLNYDLAIIDKRRTSPTDADVMHVVGDVSKKIALIVDDLVDTAGTLAKGCKALMQSGAVKVYAACAHGVLAGPAMERLEAAPIEKLVITNSIALNGKKSNKITVLSVAPLLAEAIKRIHEEKTISELFV
jgi:ribose-phosphate pyrophosphokinase